MRKLTEWIMASVVLLGLPVLHVWSLTAVGPALAPEKGDWSYAEFRAKREITGGRILQREGMAYVQAEGALPGGLAGRFYLPSGPPSYVFDSSGRLVDWAADTGE